MERTQGPMRCPLAALASRAQGEGLQSLVSWGTGVDQCPEPSLHLLPVSPRLYLPGRGRPDPQATQALTSIALCDPMDSTLPGFPVLHHLSELAQTHVHPVGDAIQTYHSLSSPSIFPRIRVFSNESVLHIRWPKYWSFSFSISPSNEYSGLISFRID